MPTVKNKPKRAYRKTSETQQIIFHTAMKLMSEKGFQGTTVREICACAGIPIGTFYNCFRSKVDILKRIYDDGDAYIQRSMEEDTDGLGTIDKLRVFAKRYMQLNEKTGIDVLRGLFYPANAWFSVDRPMQQYVKSFIEAGQTSGEIRCDLTAHEIVESLFDILRGVCYNWCVCDGSFDLSERTAFHMELFCTALAA